MTQLKLILDPDQLYKEAMQKTAEIANAHWRSQANKMGTGSKNEVKVTHTAEKKSKNIYYTPHNLHI